MLIARYTWLIRLAAPFLAWKQQAGTSSSLPIHSREDAFASAVRSRHVFLRCSLDAVFMVETWSSYIRRDEKDEYS